MVPCSTRSIRVRDRWMQQRIKRMYLHVHCHRRLEASLWMSGRYTVTCVQGHGWRALSRWYGTYQSCGTTFLAVWVPGGITKLLDIMDQTLRTKQTHHNHYLFCLTYSIATHGVSVALSNPPVMGWVKVEHTLTGFINETRRSGVGWVGGWGSCRFGIARIFCWWREKESQFVNQYIISKINSSNTL